MNSQSFIRDYLHPSDRSSGSDSRYESPPRKPVDTDEEDHAMKENHWIGNLSNMREAPVEKRTQQHFEQVITISKTTHRNEWFGQDISSVRPSCLETPIGREHHSEVEELQLEIRRLKTELQRRDANSRSKSKTKSQRPDESMLQGPANAIYMKAIGSKDIEITKLRESCSVLKSENDTLSLIVKEKEAEIELLQGRFDELNRQRKQIEGYQVAISESKSLFKEIEEKIRATERDSRLKDKTVDELKQKTQMLTERNKLSEERINALEKQISDANKEKQQLSESLKEQARQCDEWKRNYVETNRQLSVLPEFEIKLKNSLNTSKDLEERIAELLSMNEKLKLQINSQQLKDKKLQELQQASHAAIKENRERAELIESLTERLNYAETRLGSVSELQESISSLERSLEEKNREFKVLQRKLEEKTILTANAERELKRVTDDLNKFRDRNEKIDQIGKENKRLTGLLMEKIQIIEKLELEIGRCQSKCAAVSNDKMKVTSLYEQCMQTVEQLTLSIEEAKRQIEVEVASRCQFQSRCEKLTADVTALSVAMNKEKEMSKAVVVERDLLKKEIDSLTETLQEEESRFELLKSETESQISHDRRRIDQLSVETRELKKRAQVHARKDKESSEQLANLLEQRSVTEGKLTMLQESLQQSQEELRKMARWKQQYTYFMDSFKGISSAMTAFSQGNQLY